MLAFALRSNTGTNTQRDTDTQTHTYIQTDRQTEWHTVNTFMCVCVCVCVCACVCVCVCVCTLVSMWAVVQMRRVHIGFFLIIIVNWTCCLLFDFCFVCLFCDWNVTLRNFFLIGEQISCILVSFIVAEASPDRFHLGSPLWENRTKQPS